MRRGKYEPWTGGNMGKHRFIDAWGTDSTVVESLCSKVCYIIQLLNSLRSNFWFIVVWKIPFCFIVVWKMPFCFIVVWKMPFCFIVVWKILFCFIVWEKTKNFFFHFKMFDAKICNNVANYGTNSLKLWQQPFTLLTFDLLLSSKTSRKKSLLDYLGYGWVKFQSLLSQKKSGSKMCT